MAERGERFRAENFLIMPITYWRVNPAFPNGIEKRLSKTIDFNPKPTIIKNMNQKNLHLVTAVVAAIGKFHSAKSPFSAWSVTKDIRAQVNSGSLTLKDLTGGGTFGGAPKVEIPHPTVRDIVKELFAEKLLPDYTQHDTGSFIEYRFPNATPVAAPAPVVAKPRPIQVGDIVTIKDGVVWKRDWDGAKVKNVRPNGGVDAIGAPNTRVAGMEGIISAYEIASYSDTPTATVAAPVAQPTQAVKSAVNQLKTPDAPMWALVDAYIKNRNQRTTLKQIQSRLKGWKVTVREIGSYLKRQTGLYIEAPYYNSWVK